MICVFQCNLPIVVCGSMINTAVPQDKLEIFETKVDLNKLDDEGITSMDMAVVNKYFGAVRCPVEHGVDCHSNIQIHNFQLGRNHLQL